MKFIKEDGTIGEGAPLTEATATLRDNLERYFHITICKHSYHSTYSMTPCGLAANFLAVSLNNEVEELIGLTKELEAELLKVDLPKQPVVVTVELVPALASEDHPL